MRPRSARDRFDHTTGMAGRGKFRLRSGTGEKRLGWNGSSAEAKHGIPSCVFTTFRRRGMSSNSHNMNMAFEIFRAALKSGL